MNEFQCPLCGDFLEIRTSKKKKPYIQCENCGYQWFFRYEKGIRRLEELSETKISFLENYVLCRKCKVAVERSPAKIERFILREPGIRCPSCGSLLLKARDVKGAGDEDD